MRKNKLDSRKTNQQHIVCYVPVIHDGYLSFFAKYSNAHIDILGTSVLRKRFDYLRKDIRALDPETVVAILAGMQREASILEEADLEALLRNNQIIMPDDEVSRALAAEFAIQNVQFEPVFLRWDRQAIDTNQEVKPDRTITLSDNDPIIAALYQEAGKSTNWWRRVGAALVAGDTVLALAHNGSVPTAYSSAIDGDPRITANRGQAIDTTIDIHAESKLIGQAAKQGKSLLGKAIFVTTFPCPTCAKLIAASGIAQCYFVEGYAMVDGQSILQANGVEIVKVEAAQPQPLPQQLKTYPR